MPVRPRLRPVDAVVVPDRRHGEMLVLRDAEGVAERDIALSGALRSAIALMDGTRTADQIARRIARPAAAVAGLIDELDQLGFLDSPRYRSRLRRAREAFDARPTREAHHAGGSYHGEADALRSYIDNKCLAGATTPRTGGELRALVSPHMDLWRAANGYGAAYAALRAKLPKPNGEPPVFVVLGTCHAGMASPFAACRKPFETPLGTVDVNSAALDALSAQTRFDLYADEFMHRVEHSLEFQIVFIKHLMRDRPFSIVPVLCGLGDAQARRRDPMRDANAASFLDALTEWVSNNARSVVVAGADLAHVGPRFGDEAPNEEARQALSKVDDESLQLALSGQAADFFEQTTSDLDERRVCGVGPIYTLLQTLGGDSDSHTRLHGARLNYDQCVDEEDGSVVSHTSLAFYR